MKRKRLLACEERIKIASNMMRKLKLLFSVIIIIKSIQIILYIKVRVP